VPNRPELVERYGYDVSTPPTRCASRSGDWRFVAPAVGALTGAGHLAVTLVATAGARAGWTDEWRARLLRTLRAHADPDVRAAALAVTTAAE